LDRHWNQAPGWFQALPDTATQAAICAEYLISTESKEKRKKAKNAINREQFDRRREQLMARGY
jgi:hypothetical protein